MGCGSSDQKTVYERPEKVQAPPAEVAPPVSIVKPPKTPFHEQYVLLGKVGKGAFAQVHIGKRLSDSAELAVKVTDFRARNEQGVLCQGIDQGSKRAIIKEADIMARVAAEKSCVSLVEDFVEDGVGYIVMERCDLTLLQHLQRLPNLTEVSLSQVIKGMLDGLVASHDLRVVHRDVKPDNFLCISQPSGEAIVKLCDFGLAHVLANENATCKGVYGTAPFMPPEMLMAEPYDAKADIWSLGIIAYALLIGQFPYQPAERGTKAMKAAIVAGVPEPTFKLKAALVVSGQSTVSEDAVAFLRTLLSREARSRPTAKEAIQQPWLAKCTVQPSEISNFQPMLNSAKRCGAFDVRAVDKDDKHEGSLDMFLIQEQARYHGKSAVQFDSGNSTKKMEKVNSGRTESTDCASNSANGSSRNEVIPAETSSTATGSRN